jgi:GntR family transcriptional repressor for pyruvate dehydrogenase complex
MVSSLQVERLSDGIVRHVIDEIRTGGIGPGQRLPSERHLAEDLGVSRVSVREALRVLELLEVIEVRHGSGAFAAPEGGRGGGRLLRHWLTTHRREVLEMLEVREAVETRAAEAAAARMAVIETQQLPEDADFETLVAADLDFHNRVADASGNKVLASLIYELNQVLKESRYAMFAIPGRPSASQRDHSRIASAVRRGEAQKAGDAMRLHIAKVRRQVRQLDPEAEN